MTTLFRQASDILETAIQAVGEPDMAIVIDRRGGIRMLDATGWSLPGLSAEFGGLAVFRIRRHAGTASVEGWNGSEKCVLRRKQADGTAPYAPPTAHAMMLQILSPSAGGSNE